MASKELESFVDETIRKSRDNKYHPTIFMQMRERHGTIGAISRLVENGDLQSGFLKLHKLGLLDYTIEAAVKNFPNEFSKSVRDCAEFRLREAMQSK